MDFILERCIDDKSGPPEQNRPQKENKTSQPKLVGGIPTPLKNRKISWDEKLPNYM